MFGLPPKLDLDVKALEKQFYRYSRKLHPDVHARASQEEQDWSLAQASLLNDAYRKFATGIFLVWYPIKSQSAVDGFIGEVLAGGLQKALTVEIAVPPEDEKLSRAGLLVINPPYGFAAAMEPVAAILAPRLGRDGAPASIALAWLAGAE